MGAIKPIALTCGDPAGVGPEIIARWLKENPTWRNRVWPIGEEEWLDGLGCRGTVCECARDPAVPGKPTANGSRIAWEALTIAAKGCREGQFSAVVTAPVSKAHRK